jgi:soluble lytic murein transglycosylase
MVLGIDDMKPRSLLPLAFSGVLLATLPTTQAAYAFDLFKTPKPTSRPGVSAFVDTKIKTGSLASRVEASSKLERGGSVAVLKSGLDAISSRNIPRARVVRDSLPSNSLDRHILAWAIALSADPGVGSDEIANAAAMLPNWPGMAALRRSPAKSRQLRSSSTLSAEQRR